MFSGVHFEGFHGSSLGEESTCNAGDPGLILGWEDPLEKGMLTHSSILPGEFHGQKIGRLCSPWGSNYHVSREEHSEKREGGGGRESGRELD